MTLDECRRFYAEEIRYAAGLTSEALVEALARVPREKFVGPGPWKIGLADLLSGAGVTYVPTVDADPRHVYHNVTIALDIGRNLNNGQPGTLAHWIQALNLKGGERVFHLGCGVGYYTAIVAELVGPGGSVMACDVDAELAGRARANLSAYPSVSVAACDGSACNPGMCDAMLINAGVTHPLRAWLERLNEGGRLLVPITTAMGGTGVGKGVMLRIVRSGAEFSARVATFVAIYSCTSARDPQMEAAIAKGFATGALLQVKRVRLDAHEAGESCALHGDEVCLSSAAA